METVELFDESKITYAEDDDDPSLATVKQVSMDEYVLEVDGFICPEALVTQFTPLEFEELVRTFCDYDVNKSGTIDIYEVQKILYHLELDRSIEKAQEFMDLVDTDKSGEIDFDEFCVFYALMKNGDEKLQKYSNLMDKINNTPLGILEHHVKIRDLKANFVIVEEREATASTPALFVVELLIAGNWFVREFDQIVQRNETRRFQGIGASTRDAKYNAAKSAIIKLQDFMPGTRYEDGYFPDEWMEWIDKNLQRGVPVIEVVSILVRKGFHPHFNTPLMHKLCGYQALDKFLEENDDFDIDDSKTTHLDIRFINFVKTVGDKGIDGRIFLQILEDRNLEVKKYHTHFAQQIYNNELSTLTDKNGQVPVLMDFWQICKDGHIDELLLYLKSEVDVNVEKVGRNDSIAWTALMLAASNNHARVCELLIEHKANVLATDRRGRSALHIAGLNGATEACEVLMDHGSQLFMRDNQGNTALHLAASQNHTATVDFLCFKGQEFTRSITSDRVLVKAGVNFDSLAGEIFRDMQNTKLKPIETRRFQKNWLNEASNLFRSRMDPDRQHMVAPTCAEIMDDVISRFDPRPETGIFIATAREGESEFVPTIPTAQDLGILIRYMFRQSALDNTNNWGRTPLHLACDANKTRSHEETILLLIDKHGCNVSLKDMHGRTPYDLLVFDKNVHDGPTATKAREMLIFENRDVQLNEILQKFADEDYHVLQMRRKEILNECIERSQNMSQELWDVTRASSRLNKTFGPWGEYEDPDTKNLFYACLPKDVSVGDPFTGYSWSVPEVISTIVMKDAAWLFHRTFRCTTQRSIDNWDMLRCNVTGVNIYYDTIGNTYTFQKPDVYDWNRVALNAQYEESFGYSEEWQSFKKDQNTFYYNIMTKKYFWDKPADCVVVTPAERFCTAIKNKNRRVDQKWYTCEQCNRALKAINEEVSKNVMIKLCEPCVYRCHRGHKGVRLVRVSPIMCMCQTACKEFCECRATEVSATQLETLRLAHEENIERNRHLIHNILMPPEFALVPHSDPNGRTKRESGWIVCRRAPPVSIEEIGAEAIENETITSQTTVTASTAMELDSAELEFAFSSEESSIVGIPMLGNAEGAITKAFLKLAAHNFDLTVPFHQREALKQGWVEVMDPEQPEKVPLESKVLCKRRNKVARYYGIVKEVLRDGVYLVKFNLDGDKENIPREDLEVISTRTFFYNRLTNTSVWSLDEIYKNEPFHSRELQISGNDWFKLKLVSHDRRSFQEYDEMEDPHSHLYFYVHLEKLHIEQTAIKLQTWFRQRKRLSTVVVWQSTAFSFEKPAAVAEEEKVLAGWSMLRRRSTCLGEFQDIDREDWEEYMDSESADFFYWHEDDNKYTWDKPEVPQRIVKSKIIPLEVGEKVQYRFPDRNLDDVCVVIKCRKDDATGEDMYDLKSTRNAAEVKWVERYKIRKMAKTGDELKLQLMATQWKNQIRRQRAKEYRMREIIRKKRLEEEMSRRIKSTRKSSDVSTVFGAASSVEEIDKARQYRARLEKRELQEDKEKEMRTKLKDGIAKMIDNLAMGHAKLTKSDQLNLQRAMQLKLEVEAKLKRRAEAQQKLLNRRQQNRERLNIIETELREKESHMTSPRSNIRRRLLRRVHVAGKRQEQGLLICEWGCGDWVRLGQEQQDHQRNFCTRRIVSCPLQCPLKLTEDEWLEKVEVNADDEKNVDEFLGESESVSSKGSKGSQKKKNTKMIPYQQYHEEFECPKRLLACPRNCLEWVIYENLQHHLDEMCVKRAAKQITCRLGCGAVFGGMVETMIECEEERHYHEQEECEFRQVRCGWRNPDGSVCAAQLNAKDKDAHRDYHIERMGIHTYGVPGTYVYKVPARTYRLKVQLWGGGGGSGHFRGRRGGSGGGGAFVEAIIDVNPYDIFEVQVGGGGQAGVRGTEIEAVHTEVQGDKHMETKFDVIDASNGVSLGGQPGGGEGYGGGGNWAAGGGGGYSLLSRKTISGNQVFLVAAGGGGGGSIDAVPGGGMYGPLPGTRIDARNGGLATCEKGGQGGDSGNIHNCDWPASDGVMWQGGNGCQYGGGGGGGYFGGGGGGTSPGIAGGGGGGSSYVYVPQCKDYVIIPGTGAEPGGLEHNIPDAVGVGEWDKVGGPCGRGGYGSPVELHPGSNGAVRILKPGYY